MYVFGFVCVQDTLYQRYEYGIVLIALVWVQ
jgi:hypothetical protein